MRLHRKRASKWRLRQVGRSPQPSPPNPLPAGERERSVRAARWPADVPRARRWPAEPGRCAAGTGRGRRLRHPPARCHLSCRRQLRRARRGPAPGAVRREPHRQRAGGRPAAAPCRAPAARRGPGAGARPPPAPSDQRRQAPPAGPTSTSPCAGRPGHRAGGPRALGRLVAGADRGGAGGRARLLRGRRDLPEGGGGWCTSTDTTRSTISRPSRPSSTSLSTWTE